MTELIAFACPRCTTDVHEEFYGPCASCRDELVATIRGDARDVDAVAFEPKMNVVPNQVATKD
ncbi:MAG: small subunit ribosomal protein S27e [Actinomycetota bacterium]|nr:small subunit ribosomal protein S27e [Actinomycetota bacterium]